MELFSNHFHENTITMQKKLNPIIFFFLISISATIVFSCSNGATSTEETATSGLPIIPKIDKKTGEPVEHTIRPFSFVNQDSQVVNNATFKDKIYVADFFFIHCPTICPKVKANMKYMYKELEGMDDVVLLSHSIDTKHDTVPALKEYARKLEIKTNRWHLVTGDKSEIYDIAEDYVSSAKEDEYAPGGFDHSGYLVLVDKKGQVRSFARGTEREETKRLLKDINTLLKEYEG